MIFVAFGHEGAPTTYTVSDSPGNTGWSTPVEIDNTNGDMSLMVSYCKNPSTSGTHTVTVTPGASRPYRCIFGLCVTGDFSGSPVEAATTQSAQGASNSMDAGSLVTDAAAICIQATFNYNGNTTSPGSGWTEDTEANNARQIQSRIEASSGTFDPVCTQDLAGAAAWCSIAMAFKEAAAATKAPPFSPTPMAALLTR